MNYVYVLVYLLAAGDAVDTTANAVLNVEAYKTEAKCEARLARVAQSSANQKIKMVLISSCARVLVK